VGPRCWFHFFWIYVRLISPHSMFVLILSFVLFVLILHFGRCHLRGFSWRNHSASPPPQRKPWISIQQIGIAPNHRFSMRPHAKNRACRNLRKETNLCWASLWDFITNLALRRYIYTTLLRDCVCLQNESSSFYELLFLKWSCSSVSRWSWVRIKPMVLDSNPNTSNCTHPSL